MNHTADTVYYVETPTDIFWSTCKMTTNYKHVEYSWRDKVRYKTAPKKIFNRLKQTTSKKTWELDDGN